MHLYSGTSVEFVGDATQNRIADRLSESFFKYFRYRPSASELRSWKNSLRAMADVVDVGGLTDHGVIVEWQLPLTSRRLDVMLTGTDDESKPGAVVVELKQWEEAYPTHVPECVRVMYGGSLRDVLHPSAQVRQYTQYLSDTHTVFSEGDVRLKGCSFLHNLAMDESSELLAGRHADLLNLYPLFAGDQLTTLAEYLTEVLGGGGGIPVLDSVLRGRYRPHKKLLDHTAKVIRREPTYVLLDEQKVVLNTVLAAVAERHRTADRSVFLIKGGPGTGKSVVALNLVAELSAAGFVTHHATGSKAFTENLRKAVGSRAAAQFKYFNSYHGETETLLDVLVLDEAHRIRQSGQSRFTPKSRRTDNLQIDELISVARVSVFFIDDLQVVRPGEVGSSGLIRAAAERAGAELAEYELEAQFRCGGSEGFVSWVENTLELRRTADVIWEGDDEFDFDVVESPRELQALINSKQQAGSTARLVAGFCWPWSKPQPDGTLVDDVVIDDWAMPWNAKPDAGFLAPGIPKSNYWASDPGGINQVGCVYTAQGFEFDYVGVIFGRDLVYRGRDRWVGQPERSHDSVVKRAQTEPGYFTDLVKNTYRVLLTRGLKGCYVYFQDPATRDFVLSRTSMAGPSAEPPIVAPVGIEPPMGPQPAGVDRVGEPAPRES